MASNAVESLRKHLEILSCPRCRGDLELRSGGLSCTQSGHVFQVSEGIPRLFVPNDWDPRKRDVTEAVQGFYEQTPFPDYDDCDNIDTLTAKARRSVFAQLLDDQIPFGTRILECGCGTGQLSNFLSVAHRTVVGTDLCLNSLRLAQRFKEGNGLDRATFLQMNLFMPAFKPATFDLVVCNGVLHHTADPFLGFRTIAQLVRPGGFILLGLYHRYGRWVTDVRRLVFRLAGDRFTWLDPNLRDHAASTRKHRAWFADQYKNPHESKHTIGEVLRWLEATGFTFVRSIPNAVPFQPRVDTQDMFATQRAGTHLERFVAGLGMVLKGSREGGFFTVIARRTEVGARTSVGPAGGPSA